MYQTSAFFLLSILGCYFKCIEKNWRCTKLCDKILGSSAPFYVIKCKGPYNCEFWLENLFFNKKIPNFLRTIQLNKEDRMSLSFPFFCIVRILTLLLGNFISFFFLVKISPKYYFIFLSSRTFKRKINRKV